jgi:hypothetical protein
MYQCKCDTCERRFKTIKAKSNHYVYFRDHKKQANVQVKEASVRIEGKLMDTSSPFLPFDSLLFNDFQ